MSSRARPKRVAAAACMRLGAPRGVQGLSDVKKHYINVRDADLIEREVARDLASPTALRLKHRRLLTAARTCERAARGIRAALGRFGDGVRWRERRAHWLLEARRGVDQFARIGVRRIGEQGVGFADLDDAPAIHDRGRLTDM